MRGVNNDGEYFINIRSDFQLSGLYIELPIPATTWLRESPVI